MRCSVVYSCCFFFFKQKTAYEMRISDWSSDVCSSDLSDDGKEASARAGDCRGEPPALHLSGRQRRREPAASGRGVSRPRPFRAHLLQSGEYERQAHTAPTPACCCWRSAQAATWARAPSSRQPTAAKARPKGLPHSSRRTTESS